MNRRDFLKGLAGLAIVPFIPKFQRVETAPNAGTISDEIENTYKFALLESGTPSIFHKDALSLAMGYTTHTVTEIDDDHCFEFKMRIKIDGGEWEGVVIRRPCYKEALVDYITMNVQNGVNLNLGGGL